MHYSNGMKRKHVKVLSVSSGTKKGSKKSVTSGPIDSTVNLLKHTSIKLRKAKKPTGIKRPSVSKCNNILKIRDFVLYPIKASIPVTDVYKVDNHNINPTRKTLVSNSKRSSKSVTKSYNNIERLKVTRKSTKLKILKTKRNPPDKLKCLRVVKKPSTERNLKKIKGRSKHSKTVKRKSQLQSIHITRKTPRSSLVSKKTLPSGLVDENVMVLSADQFVFKPTIPITEANYPIGNSDKLELYAQGTQVDKVLSYGFTDPAIKDFITFPSVSKIIEETISDKTKQILANWRQKMIEDLGEEGFFNHSEALKLRGTEFHMAVRNAVLGNTTKNCSKVTQNSLKSLSWMLEHISNPMAVESTIAHPKLGYRGVADCIAMFRNIPVMIDWKLSDKPKRYLKDTYDAPVQITAYIGALNHDPNYKWGVNHGLVAVAYANGDPCDVFLLAPKHCQVYWRHWLMRFEKFKARSHLHLEHNIDEKYLELI